MIRGRTEQEKGKLATMNIIVEGQSGATVGLVQEAI